MLLSLPVFALALRVFVPWIHLIFLFFHLQSFCKSSLFTVWSVELYDTLAAGQRVFPEQSPLFRKPDLVPVHAGMIKKGRGRQWEDGKLQQLTKIGEPKIKTNKHKPDNANCIQLIFSICPCFYEGIYLYMCHMLRVVSMRTLLTENSSWIPLSCIF